MFLYPLLININEPHGDGEEVVVYLLHTSVPDVAVSTRKERIRHLISCKISVKSCYIL